jgi:predicted Zn-dependent peptidase
MPDRKISPEVKEISKISYLLPEKWNLSNGATVWGLKAGSQELVKIDFIFNAGSWYQSENLVAGLSNAFMNQGSKNYTAQQIAETFDFRGAYLQLNADQQFGFVSVLTLNKYLDEILKVTADVIKNPVFPKKEISVQIANRRQQFIIENSKVKTLSHKRFSQVLFGIKHPYANTNTVEDFDRLTPEKLAGFHSQNYCLNKCVILVAGNYDEELKILLERYFGDHQTETDRKEPKYIAESSDVHKHFVEKADAVQSAIRIGKTIVNRDHPDFHGLTVLTTLFGGYFGSRLMTNIREEKGYTYGIGASIVTFPHAAYFSVMTEVGTDVCHKAVDEIYIELKRLESEPAGLEELNLIRNYLLGEMLRNFDGVFAISNSLKILLEAGLDYSHYDGFIKVIKSTTPEELHCLARKYLRADDMFEVVAGKGRKDDLMLDT